jgi:hypothetical protein
MRLYSRFAEDDLKVWREKERRRKAKEVAKFFATAFLGVITIYVLWFGLTPLGAL